jgi:hypothetical protein
MEVHPGDIGSGTVKDVVNTPQSGTKHIGHVGRTLFLRTLASVTTTGIKEVHGYRVRLANHIIDTQSFGLVTQGFVFPEYVCHVEMVEQIVGQRGERCFIRTHVLQKSRQPFWS